MRIGSQGTGSFRELTLELTQKCHQNCLFCSTGKGKVSLSYPRTVSLIKKARKAGVTTLTLSGGEPDLYTRFYSLLLEASRLGYRIRILTSVNLEWKVIPTNTTVVFSIQGVDAATHDSITRTDHSLKETTLAMSDAIGEGLPVEVNIVPNQQNMEELWKTTEGLLSMGVKKVNLQKLVRHPRANKYWDQLYIDPHDERIVELAKKKRVSRDRCLRDSVHQCEAGTRKLIVDPYGTIYPCEAFKNTRYILGNLDTFIPDVLKKTSILDALKSVADGRCPAEMLWETVWEREQKLRKRRKRR
jgi:MoaA/NifB/PqqE/SkfB family radical SAM enzyme